MRDCIAAFKEMGFRVAEGPEVEWDRYNFDGVRIPEDHPARDMWDTIWVDHILNGKRSMLLRTHTSPNQVRVMERTAEPPIRVVIPGKCYRQEATDATHEWMLTQIEGLAVDEGVRMSDLKGVLYSFARKMFGQDRQDHLPPQLLPVRRAGRRDGDGLLHLCGARTRPAVRTCHGTGWIEILGAGMVHPEVLENAGYDSSRVYRLRLRHGVERVALLALGH